jgi:hypothetical protein
MACRPNPGKPDVLHFAIGRVVFDPVGVATEAVAMVQDRRAFVGLQCQLVEPSAGDLAEVLEMPREMPQRRLIEVERQ